MRSLYYCEMTVTALQVPNQIGFSAWGLVDFNHFPHLSHSSGRVCVCVCVCVCVLQKQRGTFLVVRWFRLQASTTGGLGSIPGQGSSTYHLVKPENKPHIVPTQNCMLSHSIVSNSLQPHAPLSMGFPRQEYWSGLPFPPPGDLSNPGIKPWSPALQADFFTIWATREAHN